MATIGALLALFLTFICLGGAAEAKPAYRFCGPLPPGDGAFSYTNTRGVSCRVGVRVSRRAVRRFCERPGNCEFGPGTAITDMYKGRVTYGGWRCRVKVGYEFTMADCHKGSQRIFHKSGA
jgi:hypothetical protein